MVWTWEKEMARLIMDGIYKNEAGFFKMERNMIGA